MDPATAHRAVPAQSTIFRALHVELIALLIHAAGSSLAFSSLIVAGKPVKQGIFQGSADIGKTQPGSTVYDAATGTYCVTGGGGDMWGAADQFHFSWVRVSGDASLTADIHFPAGAAIPNEKAR